MTRWIIISMIAAQLVGCAPSYEQTKRGVCSAQHKTFTPVFDNYSKGAGYECL